MSDIKEAKVPDIGDYDGVPVIEILVAVGDTVKKDQGLVTLESDKATMEVPSAAAASRLTSLPPPYPVMRPAGARAVRRPRAPHRTCPSRRGSPAPARSPGRG